MKTPGKIPNITVHAASATAGAIINSGTGLSGWLSPAGASFQKASFQILIIE